MYPIRIFIYAILIFSSFHAEADEPLCLPATGDLEGLEIGEVKILNQDIFDLEKADENAPIHRIANKLHIQTIQATIRQQLLIQPGQQYSQRLIDESERKLRTKKYIHAVSIYPEQICDDKVVITVKTSDNWTLTPNISFGRSGGINRSSFEIAESNLFGLGKEIRIKSESDEDRDSQFLQYIDDSLFGSRYQLSFKLADNSDGYFDSISIGEPFFQLDSRKALMLNASRGKKQVAGYNGGNIIDVTGQLTESVNLEKGWSTGLHDNQVFRYKLGWNATDYRYFKVQGYPDTVLPADSKKYSPYVAVEYIEDAYIQRENFNVMAIIEDIAIGNHFSAQAGVFNKSWGSTHNGFTLSANYSFGIDISTDILAFIDLGLRSEVNHNAEDFNSILFSGNWLHYRNTNHSYYLKAVYQTADKLLSTDRYVIGGDTGLRGYPIRFQTGHTKALLSAEKRTYFNWYPWKLVKFGLAIFADVGSAWDKQESPQFIKDIGFGIRLVSTRQSESKVLHLDFAYPLDELDRVDNFQLLIKSKSQF